VAVVAEYKGICVQLNGSVMFFGAGAVMSLECARYLSDEEHSLAVGGETNKNTRIRNGTLA
jgi:hypothetical protein